MGMTIDGMAMLEFLDLLAGAPSYRVTNRVRGETLSRGAGDWVATLEQQQRYLPVKNEYRKARVKHEALRKKYRGKTPGVHDVGLLLLAQQEDLVLLTDDSDLYRVSLQEHKKVLDLFDVALAGVGSGLVTEAHVKNAFSILENESPYYMPLGWSKMLKRGLSWPDGYAELATSRRDPAVLGSLLA